MFSRNLSTHLGHGERTQDPRKCRCGIPESCVLCPCSKLHPNVERVGLCFQRPYLVSQRERTSEKRRQRRVASGRRVLLSGEAEANLQIRRHRVSPIVINARSGSAAASGCHRRRHRCISWAGPTIWDGEVSAQRVASEQRKPDPTACSLARRWRRRRAPPPRPALLLAGGRGMSVELPSPVSSLCAFVISSTLSILSAPHF